jgi:apolipoprotein N-acyltransferase
LGYSQVDNGLLTRLAPWTGVMGISFLLAVGNALLAAGILYRRRVWAIDLPPAIAAGLSGKAWATYGVILAVVGSLGFKDKPPQPPAGATAMLMQPNLDVVNDDVWVGAEWDRQMAQFRKLAADPCRGFLNGMPETGSMLVSPGCDGTEARPALIVWPESPAPFRGPDPKFQSEMTAIVKADGAPLIVGNIAMDTDPATQQDAIYNSGSVVALDGHVVGRYDKIHLVPFGEYVPARRLLFFAHQLTQQLSDLGRGTERKTFRIASADGNAHRYGIFICYESVFGDEVRQFAQMGAEVLVNISDDGWYGDTSAPWQHLNMARMRAIENRRWILRDTNSGVTSAIDPFGTVRQAIPRHQVGALAAQFGYETELTFYTRHGDWLGVLCAILSVVLLVWSARPLIVRGNLRG